MNLQEIETKLRLLDDQEREVRNIATAEIRKERAALHDLKQRMIEESNRAELAALENVIPIIQRCIALAIQINQMGKYTLWVDYSGHVKNFSIRGHRGPWAPMKDDTLGISVRMGIDEFTDLEKITSQAVSAEEFLLRLLNEEEDQEFT